jgi:hypothetical protein
MGCWLRLASRQGWGLGLAAPITSVPFRPIVPLSAMTIHSTAPAPTANGHSANGNGHSARANGSAPTPNPERPSVLQMLRQPTDTGAGAAAQPSGFSPAQLAALAAPLDRSQISSREQGRGKVNYLQGWLVIREANRIFGFDGWQRQTVSLRCVTQAERPIGRDQKPGWGVTYIARVRISVYAGDRGLLIREGTGAGHGIDVDLGLAHESAIKEAETDAMKRALMTFGNPFGLALYDKSQREVSGAPQAAGQGQGRQATQAATARPATARPTPVQPVAAMVVRRPVVPPVQEPQIAQPAAGGEPAAEAPLDPPTIRSLQERIRGLLPPQLAAFSRAFRSAFQVPESTPSIAGLITEQRHRAWIQHYLSQPQAQGQGQAQLEPQAA